MSMPWWDLAQSFTPADAVDLFTAAQAAVVVVEPESLREPLRLHFAAAAELCRGKASLLGLPVVYALGMARAVVFEARAPGLGRGGPCSPG